MIFHDFLRFSMVFHGFWYGVTFMDIPCPTTPLGAGHGPADVDAARAAAAAPGAAAAATRGRTVEACRGGRSFL